MGMSSSQDPGGLTSAAHATPNPPLCLPSQTGQESPQLPPPPPGSPSSLCWLRASPIILVLLSSPPNPMIMGRGGGGGGWYTIEMNKTKAFAQHRTLEVWPFQWPVYQPKRINPLPFFPLALNSMLEFTLLQWTVWFLALQSVSFPSHNYGIVSLAGHLEASTERLCWHTPLSTNGLLTCALATFFFLSLK